jgi:hypothetical protein
MKQIKTILTIITTLLLQRNETDKNYSNDNYITIIIATIYENYIHKLFFEFLKTLLLQRNEQIKTILTIITLLLL